MLTANLSMYITLCSFVIINDVYPEISAGHLLSLCAGYQLSEGNYCVILLQFSCFAHLKQKFHKNELQNPQAFISYELNTCFFNSFFFIITL